MKHNQCVCKRKANSSDDSSDDSSNGQQRVDVDTKTVRRASGTVVIFSPWHMHVQRPCLRSAAQGLLPLRPLSCLALALPSPSFCWANIEHRAQACLCRRAKATHVRPHVVCLRLGRH